MSKVAILTASVIMKLMAWTELQRTFFVFRTARVWRVLDLSAQLVLHVQLHKVRSVWLSIPFSKKNGKHLSWIYFLRWKISSPWFLNIRCVKFAFKVHQKQLFREIKWFLTLQSNYYYSLLHISNQLLIWAFKFSDPIGKISLNKILKMILLHQSQFEQLCS